MQDLFIQDLTQALKTFPSKNKSGAKAAYKTNF